MHTSVSTMLTLWHFINAIIITILSYLTGGYGCFVNQKFHNFTSLNLLLKFGIDSNVHRWFQHGTAPHYMGPLVRVSDLPGRRCHRSASTNRLVVPPFKLSTIGSEHLMWLLLRHCHQHCPLFVKDRKRICFVNLILTLFLNLIILSSPHSGFEVALLLRPL